jgi:hypothetical protein
MCISVSYLLLPSSASSFSGAWVCLLVVTDPPKPASAAVGSDYVGRIWERNRSVSCFLLRIYGSAM